jgi:hypothetical protein
MSFFPKVKRCQSVKIWSKVEMTNEMMLFGWTVFNQYNRSLERGDVSEGGCMYSNRFYSAFAKKTKGGLCSVCVTNEGING